MNLLFGPNGSGKSLIIEAIYKFLIKKKKSHSYERIQEIPEGFLIFEENGEEIKLEREQKLNDIFELDIDDSTIKNLFFVKDSDLTIKDSSEFYDNLTSKIIGIKTADIRKIKEELLKKGRLTRARNISDSADSNKAKTQLSKAKKLLKDINEYLKSSEEEKIPDLERERLLLEEEKQKLKKTLNLLESAREKEEFEKLETDWNCAKASLERLEKLPHEETLNEFISQLNELSKEEKKSPLDEYKRKLELSRSLSQKSLIGMILITIVTTIATAINFSLFPYVVLILLPFLISTVVFYLNFGSFSKKISTREQRINDLIIRLNLILRQPISTISQGEEIIRHLQEKRKEINETFTKSIVSLEREFNQEIKQNKESLDRIYELLQGKKRNIDFNITIMYSTEEHKKTQNRIEDVEQQLENLSEKLSKHKESLNEFSHRASSLDFEDFIGEEIDLMITNLVSLRSFKNKLVEFIDTIQNQANSCIKALEIFDIMEEQENVKKEELFTKNEYLTDIIRTITNNYIKDIKYDSTKDLINISKSDGTWLTIDQLSKGEQCQTLMAIRLALAFQYLGNIKGFLIFENPLLSSDEERTLLQLSLLKTIASRGWQIIFFSSKNIIKEYFSENFGSNCIIELKRL